MTNAVVSRTISDFQFNTFAQVMERSGLAIMGAMGGFFVAALVSRANIGEINSAGILFCVILYSSAGFYLGTNIPALPSSTPISQYRAMAQVWQQSLRADQRHRHVACRGRRTGVGFHDRG